MRLVQHKKEAYWFYRFLSIFYDNFVNPFFWTEPMRSQALPLAELSKRNLRTVDVGSGTGFTTEGIVKYIDPENITCLDQSPHQMAHARKKVALSGCEFVLGDAEDLPFETDSIDRYVSAGSIEYWPEPQRGISEAYRVLKPGGVALMIGPLRPQNAFARFVADTWMLFPEEAQYHEWFEKAGFDEIRAVFIAPKWVGKEKYGIAIAGRKSAAGPSRAKQTPVKSENREDPLGPARTLLLLTRLLIGSLAGLLFIPMALIGYVKYGIGYALGRQPNQQAAAKERLTIHQKLSLSVLVAAVIAGLSYWLLT